MLEKIIKYQNDSEKNFETEKNLKSIINYIIAFILFFVSTIIAAFTFPFRFVFKKIFKRIDNSTIIQLNEKNIESILSAEKMILIDFWAEWCGPCIMMESIIEKFASESRNIRIAKVNADLNKKIIEKYQIRGLPQFVLIENGEEIKRFAGAMTMNDLNRFCDKK
ncbi:co-chaperone YbbN [uncultured Lutibacter sp.]|uniref:thioredoxin family protein n=1 Tax=uncultured Lutibacter sp. TaxID=437739 RepID=UPI002633DEFC|nr:thioredoxin family protein [uncultured Lutibacter sp.]